MEPIKIVRYGIAALFLILASLNGGCAAENYHVRAMAARQLCMYHEEATNTGPSMVWMKCKEAK